MSLLCLLPPRVQAYEQQEQQAQQQLAEQQRQFEAAVADILGIPAGQQQTGQLAEAVQEQQQLQEAEVRLSGLVLPEVLLGGMCMHVDKNRGRKKSRSMKETSSWPVVGQHSEALCLAELLPCERRVTSVPQQCMGVAPLQHNNTWNGVSSRNFLAPAHILLTCRCSSWLWSSSLHSPALLSLTAASTKPKRLG
jgi:hypothetical protein